MVEDLGSTNGTFHNGSKITSPRLLHPGDRIQVGTTVIEAQ
jgi:pSer/pThr/pTyr-binding forkhead associated (FHA) protein